MWLYRDTLKHGYENIARKRAVSASATLPTFHIIENDLWKVEREDDDNLNYTCVKF